MLWLMSDFDKLLDKFMRQRESCSMRNINSNSPKSCKCPQTLVVLSLIKSIKMDGMFEVSVFTRKVRDLRD